MAGERERPAKAWAAAVEAARRRVGHAVPDEVAAAAGRLWDRLSQWAAAELAPGRLVPWLPVAFGSGIVAYFTADREPAWWAALALAFAGVSVAVLAWRRALGLVLALGFAAVAAGFATATLRTQRIAHPVLQFPVASATLSGFVEVREEREPSDRIVLRVHKIEARRLGEAPERVRLAVRKGTAPAVGSFAHLKARLTPPLTPLRPGGYDFARDMYFQRIGASGYALGAIKTVTPPVAAGLWLSYAAFVEGIRETLAKRIRIVAPGDRGSIASALITGKRDAISAPVNDAMYISSLAHVLSISGYHMAVVVAGIVFFFIRAVLALSPSLASRRPIKKWAAGAASRRRGLLSAAFGRRSRDAAYDRDRACRRDGRPSVADLPHVDGRGFRCPDPGPGIDCASELPDVLCGDARLDRRLPERPAMGAEGRHLARRPRRTLGWARNPRADAGLARGRPCHHVVRRFPFSPRRALRRARQPDRHAGRLHRGDADGHPRGPCHAVRLRCRVLATDGVGHRLDDRRRLPGAVGYLRAFGTGPLLLGTPGLLLICLLRTPLRWSAGLYWL